MSFAANSCLTTHASTSSGMIIIQNLNLSRFHPAFHLFGCGTFGWIEIYAQIMVEMKLQTMPNRVHFNDDVKFWGSLALSMNNGAACALQ